MKKIAADRNYRILKRAITGGREIPDFSSTSSVPNQLKDWSLYGHAILEVQTPTGASIRNATLYKPDGTKVVVSQGSRIPGTNWELTYLRKEPDERGISRVVAEFCCNQGRPFEIWERGSRPTGPNQPDGLPPGSGFMPYSAPIDEITEDQKRSLIQNTKINELLYGFDLNDGDEDMVKEYLENILSSVDPHWGWAEYDRIIQKVENSMRIDQDAFLDRLEDSGGSGKSMSDPYINSEKLF